MDQYDWYFKQPVTPSELTQAFTAAERSIQSMVQGAGLRGLALNGEVVERAPTPVMGVNVVGPLVAYDENGNRIYVASTQPVDLASDENSASTAVVTAGQERYLSVFVKFERALAEPRLDGNGETVWFARTESYKFVVAAGAPAAVNTASRPLLRAGHVLLADIRVVTGQTTVETGNILTDRTQYMFRVIGSAVQIRSKTIQQVVQDLVTAMESVSGAIVNTAAGVSFSPAAGIGATNVQAALVEVAGDVSNEVSARTTLAGTVSANQSSTTSALAGKANLAGGNTFTGDQTLSNNVGVGGQLEVASGIVVNGVAEPSASALLVNGDVAVNGQTHTNGYRFLSLRNVQRRIDVARAGYYVLPALYTPVGAWTRTGQWWQGTGNAGILFIDITPELPNGAIFRTFDLRVTLGNHAGRQSNQHPSWRLYRVDQEVSDFALNSFTEIPSEGFLDGLFDMNSTTSQTISRGPYNHVVDVVNYTYRIAVQNSDPSTSHADYVQSAKISYDIQAL